MIIQFCGLSGSGKTTIANLVKDLLAKQGLLVEVIDGDEYRQSLCADLGFSKEDRHTNIRRLAFVASRFSNFSIIPIICAINPYEQIRQEVARTYCQVKTVYIKCSLHELINRDTKGLYRRSFLPDGDQNKVTNLTGVNDPFEEPEAPDLVLQTDKEAQLQSAQKLIEFINSFFTST